ncbi:hypothetical protein VSWAT3_20600 [Vibrionales bacterium SWAT-3]|nr:hypothetical protein VSWAT3_20600 [Vibrionales bacterium SWAT-3]
MVKASTSFLVEKTPLGRILVGISENEEYSTRLYQVDMKKTGVMNVYGGGFNQL